VHQVGNSNIVNSWCTVRKTSSYVCALRTVCLFSNNVVLFQHLI